MLRIHLLIRDIPHISRRVQTKEIKNGRLAILANLGFAFQYAATGKGPITNLFDHIADPVNNTFATNGVSIPFVMPLGS